MTELNPTPELPIYIDNTMITTFRACGKKFEWSFLQNLRPPGKSVHLIAGGAIAAGIDAARKYWFTSAAPTWEHMLIAATKSFMAEWKDFQPPENPNRRLAKTFDNCWYAMEQYLIRYHPKDDPIQPLIKSDGSPTVEFSFAIPLPINHPSGSPFIYCGRFDMLGKWNDLLTVTDEKTASALGSQWVDQWGMRGQFLGYCWACQQLGYPVRQVAVRGIGILLTEIKFMTALQQFPQYLIDRWYEELLGTVQEIVTRYEYNRFTYNFGDSCSSYSGCSYRQLCESRDAADWVSNYEVSVWNPLLRDEKQPDLT